MELDGDWVVLRRVHLVAASLLLTARLFAIVFLSLLINFVIHTESLSCASRRLIFYWQMTLWEVKNLHLYLQQELLTLVSRSLAFASQIIFPF